jgi:hypothetical protein
LERLSNLLTKAQEGRAVDVTAALCADYLTLLYSRRAANYYRNNRYQTTFLLAVPTVVVTAAELIVALAARIQ